MITTRYAYPALPLAPADHEEDWHPDDILVWPDGDWCYRDQRHKERHSWRGPSYRVIHAHSDEWNAREGISS